MKGNHERSGHTKLSLVGEDGQYFVDVLQRLMEALEPYQAKSPELHQLYLESQWLLSNQQHGMLILPNDWNLIVFDLVNRDVLRKYPNAYSAAKQLIDVVEDLINVVEDLINQGDDRKEA